LPHLVLSPAKLRRLESCKQGRSRLIGSPRFLLCSPVSKLAEQVFLSTTVSLVIREGHPHLPFALPRSSFTHFTAHAFRRSLSYQGLGPRRDLTRSRPLIVLQGTRSPRSTISPAPALGTPMLQKNSSSPASVRPQALSASRRFTPRTGLRACFIPQPCSGPLPFRGFSLRAASLSSREVLPPCRSVRARSPVARLPPARTSTSRPFSARSSVAPTKR